jgi:hypothetical protein
VPASAARSSSRACDPKIEGLLREVVGHGAPRGLSVALADDYGGSEGDAFDALALLSTDDARVGWVTKSRT